MFKKSAVFILLTFALPMMGATNNLLPDGMQPRAPHAQRDQSGFSVKKALLLALTAVGCMSQPTVAAQHSALAAPTHGTCPLTPNTCALTDYWAAMPTQDSFADGTCLSPNFLGDETCLLPESDDTCPVPPVVRLERPYKKGSRFAVEAACDRPARTGGIRIAREDIDGQTRIHNYGHSGSGFTTSFGSVEESLALLNPESLSENTPIGVIGDGLMGKLSALELIRRGHNVTIYTKDRSDYDIPSWRAGGFFDPGTGSESSAQDQFQLGLGLDTYHTLCAIARGEHPYLTREIVEPLPIYYPADAECEVEVLAQRGSVPPSERVSIAFGNGDDDIVHHNFQRQMTYFIHVVKFMQQLNRNVKKANIPVIEGEIHSFDELPQSIIFNTSGLGSRMLANDTAMYPRRGHYAMVADDASPTPLDYMLLQRVPHIPGTSNLPGTSWIYSFPKKSYVYADGTQIPTRAMIGGTAIPY